MTDSPAEKSSLHPAVAGVLRFFEFGHLPAGPIRDMADVFASFADHLAQTIDPDPELTVALRKLLESKDAAVRAVVLMVKAKTGERTIVNPSEFDPAIKIDVERFG